MQRISRFATHSLSVLGMSLALIATTGCERNQSTRKQKYLESGIRYETNGKYREAAIQFANAIKIDPNFAPAHYELGMTYVKMGNMITAFAELSQAVDHDPGNEAARIQLGNMMLAGGEVQRAQQQVQAVLSVDRSNADAYALDANIGSQLGAHDQALSNIRKAISLDPNRMEFHTSYALIVLGEPNGEAIAEEELQHAIALAPANATPHMILAGLFENRGDHKRAELQTQQAIELNPRDLQARRNLSGIYLRAGNKAEAEQTLRKASADLCDTAAGAELLSQFYLGSQDTGSAESAYADLVAKNPDSVELKYVYARILIIAHKDDEASQITDQLAKTSPKSANVQILKAALLLNKGNPAEAFSMLKKAVKLAPDNYDLQLALARVGIQNEDLKDAEYHFHQAGTIVPGSKEVAAGLAIVADARGDYSMLAQIAEAALSLDPQFTEAYVWRGTAEANQKLDRLAEKDFQTALAGDPADVPALAQLGQLRVRENRWPEGLDLLNKALDLCPGSNLVLGLLVGDYNSIHQPEKAIARIQQQLEREPHNTGFLTLLSETQLATNDVQGARNSAGMALHQEPGNLRAVQDYAAALARGGDVEGAQSVWTQWLEVHPTDGLATSMLAQLQQTRGNVPQAEELYKRALLLDPHQTLASNNLAYLMVENKENLDVALSLAQDAHDGSHQDPGTTDTLAWVLYNKGLYTSARDLLEDSIRNAPNNADAEYHLGLTYARLGERSAAIGHFKKAASLAPNSQTARNANAALFHPI